LIIEESSSSVIRVRGERERAKVVEGGEEMIDDAATGAELSQSQTALGQQLGQAN